MANDGSVKCWGDGFYGQLGQGTWDSSSVAVSVSGMTSAMAIAAGGTDSC
jgi:alpha-tubulin suppressor-like RCC1 family protein